MRSQRTEPFYLVLMALIGHETSNWLKKANSIADSHLSWSNYMLRRFIWVVGGRCQRQSCLVRAMETARTWFPKPYQFPSAPSDRNTRYMHSTFDSDARTLMHAHQTYHRSHEGHLSKVFLSDFAMVVIASVTDWDTCRSCDQSLYIKHQGELVEKVGSIVVGARVCAGL